MLNVFLLMILLFGPTMLAFVDYMIDKRKRVRKAQDERIGI